MSPPLCIAAAGAASADLVEALGAATRVEVPALPEHAVRDGWGAALDEWRADARRALPAPAPAVVVSALGDPVARRVASTSFEQWRAAYELPFVLWFTALQLASDCCADGGSIVLVVDGPDALDSIGLAPTVALADGLTTAARSLALREGPRSVRVNTVASSVTTHDPAGQLPGTPPMLASSPGTVQREIAGAVRFLLADDACGLTGTTLHPDGGRRWR
jgi:NAD(P)-dependent dehydrogenase (short-subunit alcohol dehydrogenase family)